MEATWREYASQTPDDYEYLLGAAAQLSRYDKGGLAGELCLTLGMALLDREDPEPAFLAARAALKASQRTEGLRDFLVEVYGRRHAGNPNVDAFLVKSGLAGEGGGLRAQVEALDRFLAFEEGAHVFHRGGWGYGEVVEFDPDEERMVIDFEHRKGHSIGIQNAARILERLPADHIGVYKHYRREELQTLIDDDPAGVFHIFLKSAGGKATLKQVREEFVPDVIEKAAWSKWWGRAKRSLLKDPEVRVGKGSSPLLELRDEAKTVEQEVVEKFRAQPDGLRQAGVAREYLRSLDLTDELAAAVGGEVDRSLEASPDPSSARLALLYLKVDLKQEGAELAKEEIRPLLLGAEDLPGLLRPLELADRRRAVLDIIHAGGERWPERIVAVMRSGDAEVADVALEHLKAARPDILIALFSELSARPQANPDLFLWYVRGLIQKTIPEELAPGEKDSSVMEKLLTLADRIGLEQKRSGDPVLKEWLRHLRSFFTSRRLRLFREFAQERSLNYARYLYAKIQRNRGFTDQTKRALLDVIEDEYPSIHTAPEEKRSGAASPSREKIYTTLIGYRTREAELKQIIEVEVPKNAEDLGHAASHGDISENAEYSAALEKQDWLMRRVRELREALDKSHIIDPDEVTTERVVVGTQVRLNNITRGGEESYCLLGPWDSDVDKGIISYLSPVGLGLMGKPPGARAEIQLPEGQVTYEILSIEPAPEELLAPSED